VTTNIKQAEHPALQALANAEAVYVVGVNALWKKSWQQFFGHLNPRYVNRPQQVPAGAHALIWGRRTPVSEFRNNVTLYRVEDGFIRSVGLGAEFARPCSWVIDRQGLYFDATGPSDLEQLLQQAEFDNGTLNRASQLIDALTRNGISKYNTGNSGWQAPHTDKPLLLVPGQVEDDASIEYGSPTIKTNLGLLRQVRAQNPQAFVIYKPHPDVVAGARAEGSNEHSASEYCDAIVTHANIIDVLNAVDEVHTLTSLTGFEALIRGKTVHCYGQPFYSGWGLTQDHSLNTRRTSQRTLNELVAATLIEYPLYVIPSSQQDALTTPENVLEWLQQQRQHTSFTDKLKQKSKRQLRQLINRLRR
jgi:capsular polysaccharide export protein